VPLVKLEIPPGVYRNATAYQAGPRWYDANLVRWDDGVMLPVGGWQRITTTPMTGVCRSLMPWRTNGGLPYLAVGTNEKLYVHNNSGLVDITPEDFTPGRAGALPGLGYGTAEYGLDDYGTPRDGGSSLILDAATWTYDTWGQNLIACCNSDGDLYEWELSESTPAAPIPNAPQQCRGVLVTEQRHVMALGAGGDPKKVQWSDQENNELWAPAANNQAGDFLLSTTGQLRAGVKIRGEILLLTSEDAHVARFIGQPLIFSFERVGTDCGIISPSAHATIGSGAVWMGRTGNFYTYDGAVRTLPCDVGDYVLQTLDVVKGSQVTCGHLSERHEIWWFYPSVNSADMDNDSYVVWNYQENWWAIGSMQRTAWTDRGIWQYPVAASQDGHLYQHEQGYTASGQSRIGTVFAQSGAFGIGTGDRIGWVTQVMPDEKTQGDVSITLKARYTPTGSETTFGPYLVRADGYTDTRAQGREMKVRIDAIRDDAWRVGNFRAEVKPGGGR
jgi:hypothetical protein